MILAGLRRRLLRSARAAGVGLGIAMLSSSCGGAERAGIEAPRRAIAPQWQDVFDGVPDVYVVVRPQAIKQDAVFGALFKAVLRVAQARTEMRGVTSLEALEGSDEIIVGLRKDDHGEDAAMVFRGVPASLDPQRMTDAAGNPMLRLVDARTKVPEYEWASGATASSTERGSLFVLPDRTWVGTIGEARARARQAFATPLGRPAPKVDPGALATARFDAAAFLRGPRFAKSALVGPLVKKLQSLTLALMPGKGGVVATLHYDDEDASAWAEMHAKRIIDEIAKTEPAREKPALAWLKGASVRHEGSALVVKVSVPARLLEELPNASGKDIPL